MADCGPRKVPKSKKQAKADSKVVSAAVVFKALGDETRLQILQLLAGSETDLCACDIEEHFSLTQPTISHHMKILREAGLVDAEKRGAWVYYSVERNGERALKVAAKLSAKTRLR